jgi:acyl-CoA synthetase (AMP-forming)/AMP-acid ligase II
VTEDDSLDGRWSGRGREPALRLASRARFSIDGDRLDGCLVESTVLAGVPSMFRALLADSAVTSPNLRLILTGGEVLAPRLAHAMGRLAPGTIHDLYGLTETGSCDFCLSPADQPHGFGTIGHPTDRVVFRLARDGRAASLVNFGTSTSRAPFMSASRLTQRPKIKVSCSGDSTTSST